MAMQAEYTDTFSGEANYCWVRHAHIVNADLSDKQIVRRVKKHFGLTGHRCDVDYNSGDMITIRPRNMARVIFINYCELQYCKGDNLD